MQPYWQKKWHIATNSNKKKKYHSKRDKVTRALTLMHSIGQVRLVETKVRICCQTCISHIMQCINSIIAWTFELSVYPFKNVLCSCSFDSCKWYSVWNSSLFQPENGTKDKHSAAVQCDCCSFVLCILFFFFKKSRWTLMLQNIRYTKVETVTNVDTHPSSSSSACFSLNTASRWRKPSMSKMQLYFNTSNLWLKTEISPSVCACLWPPRCHTCSLQSCLRGEQAERRKQRSGRPASGNLTLSPQDV